MKIDTTIFRPAGFVQLAIDHLTESIILGALLVLLVLGLFLYDWRSALISVITMPLSLWPRAWCSTCEEPPSTRWSSRGW